MAKLTTLTSFQRVLLFGYGLAALVNALAWLAVIWLVPHQATITITHYNVFFGPDGFGQWYELLLVPALGTLMCVGNLLLTWQLWPTNRFLATSLAVSCVFIEFAVALASLLLVNINRV